MLRGAGGQVNLEGIMVLGAEEQAQQHPPPRLFERLRSIPGYTWDDSQAFHSSYDNWYVCNFIMGKQRRCARWQQTDSHTEAEANLSKVQES